MPWIWGHGILGYYVWVIPHCCNSLHNAPPQRVEDILCFLTQSVITGRNRPPSRKGPGCMWIGRTHLSRCGREMVEISLEDNRALRIGSFGSSSEQPDVQSLLHLDPSGYVLFSRLPSYCWWLREVYSIRGKCKKCLGRFWEETESHFNWENFFPGHGALEDRHIFSHLLSELLPLLSFLFAQVPYYFPQ